jgi:hypothetical protein
MGRHDRPFPPFLPGLSGKARLESQNSSRRPTPATPPLSTPVVLSGSIDRNPSSSVSLS